MDIAITLDRLIPGAKYGGSVTANTQESYDEIRWEDERTKPTWVELEAAWIELQAIVQKERAIHTIQGMLDAQAKELGFDTVHTGAVWTISKNVARKARADALVAWGDAVWDFAEAEWEKQSEGKGTYSTVDEFLAALPKFPGVVG